MTVTDFPRDLFETYARDALAAKRYDVSMGHRLEGLLSQAGFTVERTLWLPDGELSFNGPASPNVLSAWRNRRDGMRLFQEHCGDEYVAVRDEFLSCLASPEHRSRSRVAFVLARKERTR